MPHRSLAARGRRGPTGEEWARPAEGRLFLCSMRGRCGPTPGRGALCSAGNRVGEVSGRKTR